MTFDFFKGWRRKVGCVSLALAVAFTAGWIRSLSIMDRVIAYDNLGQWTWPIGFGSHDGTLSVGWRPRTHWTAVVPHWRSDNMSIMGDYRTNVEWRFQCLGIKAGTVPNDDQHVAWLPYWSITLPLTLISAYLLLWKSRKIASQN